MKPTIFYLYGFSGTGKYTIAKAICELEDVKLVDNHLINIPLFTLLKVDGKTPLPSQIWDNVGKIWDAVLDTIENISPNEYSFVLTNALSNENPDDQVWFERVSKASENSKRLFIPIRLIIDIEENERRIISEERSHRLKETDPKAPKRNAQNSVLLSEHPHELTLDVTNLSPMEAARAILAHAASYD